MIDFSGYKLDDLQAMRSALEGEIQKRQRSRAEELIQNFISALDAIKKEFPWMTCYVELEDAYHSEKVEVDILEADLRLSEFSI